MNILLVVSEVTPFVKTGGLADVAGALPKALARLGHDVRVILPRYREVEASGVSLTRRSERAVVQLDSRAREGSLVESRMPGGTIPVYLVEQPALFDRDGVYQAAGTDFSDNLERFSFFSQAMLALIPQLGWRPDIVHGHDWQTALGIAHLKLTRGSDRFWRSARTLFTVHNLAYQGVFPSEGWALTGLPDEAFRMGGLEFYGKVNCLKGGLVYADRLSTVSPTYAEEVQTPAFGCGLDGLLRQRRDRLTGILNGIDVDVWDPNTDPHLAARYNVRRLSGKARCKAALQRQCRLPQQPALLIGMIQRLAEQKGIDLLLETLPRLMEQPIQIALLGNGDPRYQERLTKFAKTYPDRVSVTLRFDEVLAHRIEAGADAFLMPSRFEPCGLNQMYSMRYGTVPVVHRTGGLADTVTDVTPKTLANRTARGFVFRSHAPQALLQAVERTLQLFADRRAWTQVMRTGMQQDFSWDRSARAYVQLYEQAMTA
ncbi:MAG: glycogen synthase GlgA [Candidatus Omnitrophica bacterium]|nr:glycogen synthase GlgA [Candidatus Omnitrophota bacterium]